MWVWLIPSCCTPLIPHTGYCELSLPVYVPRVMCNGAQAQAELTLHEHLCVHLSSMMVGLSTQHFRVMVSVHRLVAVVSARCHSNRDCIIHACFVINYCFFFP